MTRALSSEWLKLQRRGMYIGLALMALLGGGVSTLLTLVTAAQAAGLRGDRGPGLRQILTLAALRGPNGLASLVAGGASLLGVIALVMYAMSFASEYSQGTIRNLLVREPHRLRLLFGKLAGSALFVSIGVVGAGVVSVIVAYAVAPSQNIGTSTWSFTAVGAALGRILLVTLGWGVLGAVLALIVRTPAPAVGAGVVYVLLVDPIVNAAWSTGGRWLPGHLLQAVAQGGTTDASLTRASIVVTLYMAVILAVGAAQFVRREVTA